MDGLLSVTLEPCVCDEKVRWAALSLIECPALRRKFISPIFGITELGKKSRKIFEFKRLICKIFWNKDLTLQRALQIGLGQLRGPSWLTDEPRNCPNQISIVGRGEAYVNGFDRTDTPRPGTTGRS